MIFLRIKNIECSGTLPTHELLTQNNLREFRPIVHAIRTGNLGLMEDALAKYEFFFVRTGIYLLGTGFYISRRKLSTRIMSMIKSGQSRKIKINRY